MNPALRPRVRTDLILRHLDEDFVVHDPMSDKTLLLNLSAALVLELCDGSRTVEEVISATARVFRERREVVGRELEDVVAVFYREGYFEGRSEDGI